MAKYKIWLTVKDRYGTEKELDGGCINVDLSTLETDEVEAIDKHFATDAEIIGRARELYNMEYIG